MSQHLYLDPPHSIRDLLHGAIARTPHLFGRHVQIDVIPGAVVISGVVSSYYHKQLAQESLRPLVGTAQIQNRLEVLASRASA